MTPAKKKTKKKAVKVKKPIIIVYSFNDEVLVCTPATEQLFIKEWFNSGGRYTSDYDRKEVFSANDGCLLKVMASAKVDTF